MSFRPPLLKDAQLFPYGPLNSDLIMLLKINAKTPIFKMPNCRRLNKGYGLYDAFLRPSWTLPHFVPLWLQRLCVFKTLEQLSAWYMTFFKMWKLKKIWGMKQRVICWMNFRTMAWPASPTLHGPASTQRSRQWMWAQDEMHGTRATAPYSPSCPTTKGKAIRTQEPKPKNRIRKILTNTKD